MGCTNKSADPSKLYYSLCLCVCVMKWYYSKQNDYSTFVLTSWDYNPVIIWKSIMVEFTRAQHFVRACHAFSVSPQLIELHQHPHLWSQ
uniref:Late blight resistance protein n=1 Tax=Solanum tuberosum TaxID=4113 RepID=M1CEF4_SOLTU